MRIKIQQLLFFSFCFLCFYTSLGHAYDRLGLGSVRIKPELRFDYYSHKLDDKWSTTRSGYKDINYNYTHDPSTTTTNDWETVSGQTLLLDMEFNPSRNLSADLGFKFINDYADKFWMPINLEHRMSADGTSFYWERGKVNYKVNNWANVQYLRGKPFNGWGYEGDMFGLFPPQNDTSQYLRVSGSPVPEMWQININKRKFGKLQVIYGPEAIWDYKNGVYINYAFRKFKADFNLIWIDHIIPYGDPDERMKTAEIASRFKFYGNPLEIGLMYRPFRLDREYTYVENVALGTGVGGSKYLEKTETTNANDAVGYSAKIRFRKKLLADEVSLRYAYQGLVAGNKQETEVDISQKISKKNYMGLSYIRRQPLLGPVPYVCDGTIANPGPALLLPRGPESPFWVGWGDPNTGDNRDAHIISLVHTYDPTPESWFYRYEPNLVETWNLNPLEKSKYSCGAALTLTSYPGGTDRLLYKDSLGRMLWDEPYTTGAWATDNFITEFKMINRVVLRNWQMNIDFAFGDSLATNSVAYTTSTLEGKAITNYFTVGVSLKTGPYNGRIRYSKDYWGPELWHRQYGETFDTLYQFDISRDFNDMINFGIGYTSAKETDDKYITTELGAYDEIRCSLTVKFGTITADFKEKTKKKTFAKLYGIRPGMDDKPPYVKLAVSGMSFSPNGDGIDDKILLKLSAVDNNSGIYEWKVLVKDTNGNVVTTISGEGQPPESVWWNGAYARGDRIIAQGDYTLQLVATDGAGNKGTSDVFDVYIITDQRWNIGR
ncbi:hypothetical protein ACFL58_00550 [Elusimicrobiota bacterium]